MFSLVTACMNREAHLRQSLPRWLHLPQLAEIIVVDWSNRRSLEDLRTIDSRVHVIRVEDEPKWILSYAYNLGIARATQPLIVKCDADCIPRPELAKHFPEPTEFAAGHWRSGTAAGKPSVNGQCVYLKSQFEAVGGYSEVIRTYGRDDEDLYDRLIARGWERREIPPACLDFLEHSHDDRTANQFAEADAPSLEQRIGRDPLYNEMHNCWVARLMPWTAGSRRAIFEPVAAADRLQVVRRDRSREIAIPPAIEIQARVFALRYMAKQVAGLSEAAVNTLDARACLAVIGTRISRAPRQTTVPSSAV
jgi:hypothetical protein